MNGLPEGRAEAVVEARKAVAVADRHHRGRPSDVRARSLLASSTFTAAVAGDMAESSLADWKKAGALYEALLAEQRDSREHLRNVAMVEKYFGTYYQYHADPVRALQHYERALALDEKRLSMDPTNRQTQGDVAIDLSNVADIHWRQGYPSAVDLFERSLTLRQSLADSDPKDELARSRVAYVHTVLARVYREMEQISRALEHGREAVRIFESIALTNRATIFRLADVSKAIGKMEDDRGNKAVACAAYDRSFDLFTRLDDTDRSRINGNGDPLDEVAPPAAACGSKAAQAWLASAKVAPQN